MSPCPYRQLSEDERRRIDRLYCLRHPVGEMARIVGRHRVTIYRFAHSAHGLADEIFRRLPKRRRRRRPRQARGQRGLQVPDSMSIAHRPAPISGCQEFGHWEGDLLMFRKELGKANVTSLVERMSRQQQLCESPSRRSQVFKNRRWGRRLRMNRVQ